jgi:hypothetical protein
MNNIQETPKAVVISDEDAVAKILENLPKEGGVDVTLPSKGLFYKGKPNSVTVTPLTFEGEKRILSLKKSDLKPINALIDLCVKGVDVEEICSIDKLYLIVKIREVSNGTDFSVGTSCESCRHINKLEVDLSKLLVNFVEDDATDIIEVYLPIAKKTAKVRLPRIKDEIYMSSQLDVMDNLWRFVVELDGYTKSTIISKVIPKLGVKDRKVLIEGIVRTDYGINSLVNFECDSCNMLNTLELPITQDFFTVR